MRRPLRPGRQSGDPAGVGTEEAFRVLRSNLMVSIAQLERPTVVVTSALPNEGKTVTCANLARSLALAGQRVVLVDADLRHADVHRLVRAHNEYGLSDALLDRRPLDDCLQFVELGSGDLHTARGLYFLAAGEGVRSPTELLATSKMSRLLATLAGQADIVLLDTPPVLPVADTLVIGRMVAGALLVVEGRSTPIEAVLQAKDALTRNQTRLLGVVLNKQQSRDIAGGFGYGYGPVPDRDLRVAET